MALRTEEINNLFARFEAACRNDGTMEFWSARDLQSILGYNNWQNFLLAIERAQQSCMNAGNTVTDHFTDASKVIQQGVSGCVTRNIADIYMTRYACYLLAMNGDSRKPEIAFAQTYFAVQTRKQELIEQRLLEQDRLYERERLSGNEKVLSKVMYDRGLNAQGFGTVRSHGDAALFGGFNTEAMKERLNVPQNRPLADFLPTVTIAGKNFATELTHLGINTKNLQGVESMTDEHIRNNNIVRNAFLEHGTKPEDLPVAEDIRKVERRLNSETRSLKLPNKRI